MGLNQNIKAGLGFLRSYLIYNGNPLKRSRLRRFYKQFINPGDLCFDIGAHIGIQTYVWNLLGAKTISVEPNPKFFNYLNKRLGHLKGVTLVPFAIAAEEAEKTMFLSSLAPTVSTLAGAEWRDTINTHSNFDVQWDQKITVQTVTLDKLIKTYGMPKFIKLDIEDYEWAALKALHYSPQYISFEFFSYLPDRVIGCIKEIEKNGNYKYNYSVGESFKLEFDEWKGVDSMLNWISCRSENDPNGDIIASLYQNNYN